MTESFQENLADSGKTVGNQVILGKLADEGVIAVKRVHDQSILGKAIDDGAQGRVVK